MRLKYYSDNMVLDAGTTKFHEIWYDDWLQTITAASIDIIFFLVVDSTDVDVDGFKPIRDEVYGHCLRCGSVETKLNNAIGTVDFSDIGESAKYPVGRGCELCD